MWLVCKTDSESSDFDFCAVHMTAALAAKLLGARDVVRALLAYDDHAYCVECFTGAARYGPALRGGDGGLGYDHGWVRTDRPDPVMGPIRYSAATFQANERGVLFRALPKHGCKEFDTHEISWDDLESLAEGHCPFPNHQPPGEDRP